MTTARTRLLLALGLFLGVAAISGVVSIPLWLALGGPRRFLFLVGAAGPGFPLAYLLLVVFARLHELSGNHWLWKTLAVAATGSYALAGGYATRWIRSGNRRDLRTCLLTLAASYVASWMCFWAMSLTTFD